LADREEEKKKKNKIKACQPETSRSVVEDCKLKTKWAGPLEEKHMRFTA